MALVHTHVASTTQTYIMENVENIDTLVRVCVMKTRHCIVKTPSLYSPRGGESDALDPNALSLSSHLSDVSNRIVTRSQFPLASSLPVVYINDTTALSVMVSTSLPARPTNNVGESVNARIHDE